MNINLIINDVCVPTGESNQMEKPRWAHGWADHQRGASDAPRGVPGGTQAGSLEGDLSLRGCLHPAGDTLWTQPRQTGEPLAFVLDNIFFFIFLFVFARDGFACFDFSLILSILSTRPLCRRRVRAAHYVMVPWLTCAVPPCCGGQVRG